jgi:hypothetical protein
MKNIALSILEFLRRLVLVYTGLVLFLWFVINLFW